MRSVWGAVVSVLAIASSGCATIAHGTRQAVVVTSEPADAAITVLSTPPGKAPVVRSTPGVTPLTLDLTRRDPDITIRFEKQGCHPVEIRLKRSVSGWTAANLVLANPFSMQGMTDPAKGYATQLAVGLPLAFGLDVLSGGAFKLPTRVHATLCAVRIP